MSEEILREASPDGNEMLLNGRAPLPGQLMTFPALAQSFREIATHGKDGFYKGRIAEEIVKIVKIKGGVMELEDLAKHKTDFVDPIKYVYRDEIAVYEVRGMILRDGNSLKRLVPSEWARYASTDTHDPEYDTYLRYGLQESLL